MKFKSLCSKSLSILYTSVLTLSIISSTLVKNDAFGLAPPSHIGNNKKILTLSADVSNTNAKLTNDTSSINPKKNLTADTHDKDKNSKISTQETIPTKTSNGVTIQAVTNNAEVFDVYTSQDFYNIGTKYGQGNNYTGKNIVINIHNDITLKDNVNLPMFYACNVFVNGKDKNGIHTITITSNNGFQNLFTVLTTDVSQNEYTQQFVVKDLNIQVAKNNTINGTIISLWGKLNTIIDNVNFTNCIANNVSEFGGSIISSNLSTSTYNNTPPTLTLLNVNINNNNIPSENPSYNSLSLYGGLIMLQNTVFEMNGGSIINCKNERTMASLVSICDQEAITTPSSVLFNGTNISNNVLGELGSITMDMTGIASVALKYTPRTYNLIGYNNVNITNNKVGIFGVQETMPFDTVYFQGNCNINGNTYMDNVNSILKNPPDTQNCDLVTTMYTIENTTTKPTNTNKDSTSNNGKTTSVNPENTTSNLPPIAVINPNYYYSTIGMGNISGSKIGLYDKVLDISEFWQNSTISNLLSSPQQLTTIPVSSLKNTFTQTTNRGLVLTNEFAKNNPNTSPSSVFISDNPSLSPIFAKSNAKEVTLGIAQKPAKPHTSSSSSSNTNGDMGSNNSNSNSVNNTDSPNSSSQSTNGNSIKNNIPNDINTPFNISSKNIYKKVGKNRYETSIKTANMVNSKIAVLASGTEYSDALSSTNLVNKLNAKLMLVDINTDFSKILKNINKVYIIGGYTRISKENENKIRKIVPNTIRIAGKNRYSTNYKTLKITKYKSVGIASGRNYADSLSAYPLLRYKKLGLMLVDGRYPIKHDKNLYSNKISYTFGGKNSIKYPIGKVIAGSDRYKTNIAINNYLPQLNNAVLTSGRLFADALSSINVINSVGGKIYLVDKNINISQLPQKNIYIVGGQIDLINK